LLRRQVRGIFGWLKTLQALRKEVIVVTAHGYARLSGFVIRFHRLIAPITHVCGVIALAGIASEAARTHWTWTAWLWAACLAYALVIVGYNVLWLCCPLTLLEVALQVLAGPKVALKVAMSDKRVHLRRWVWWQNWSSGTVALSTTLVAAVAPVLMTLLAWKFHSAFGLPA
jgi:hypothetical protein